MTSSAVMGLAACTLLTPLDGLTGGSPDGGSATDGSSSGATSSSSGGSSSGSVAPGGDADGGLPGDGADEDTGTPHPPLDAGRIADAGGHDSSDSAPNPYCASLSPAPLFCDDFDEGALATPWDQLAATSGSETLSTADYVSAPYAMLASVDPNASVTAIDVAGYKSFTAKQGVAGTATTTFDIRVDTADESSASDAIVGAIQLWNGSTIWDLELEVFYASATGDFTVSMSEDGTSYVQHMATQHLPMAAWTRVTLAIVLPTGTGGATTATMAFNGTTVANATVHVSTSNPIPEILIGTTYATPTAAGWSVAYDNVTFDEP